MQVAGRIRGIDNQSKVRTICPDVWPWTLRAFYRLLFCLSSTDQINKASTFMHHVGMTLLLCLQLPDPGNHISLKTNHRSYYILSEVPDQSSPWYTNPRPKRPDTTPCSPPGSRRSRTNSSSPSNVWGRWPSSWRAWPSSARTVDLSELPLSISMKMKKGLGVTFLYLFADEVNVL